MSSTWASPDEGLPSAAAGWVAGDAGAVAVGRLAGGRAGSTGAPAGRLAGVVVGRLADGWLAGEGGAEAFGGWSIAHAAVTQSAIIIPASDARRMTFLPPRASPAAAPFGDSTRPAGP
jgi:hypothetical protein